jgi:hypothetical protein
VDVLALDNEGQTAAGIAAARGLAKISEVNWFFVLFETLRLDHDNEASKCVRLDPIFGIASLHSFGG